MLGAQVKNHSRCIVHTARGRLDAVTYATNTLPHDGQERRRHKRDADVSTCGSPGPSMPCTMSSVIASASSKCAAVKWLCRDVLQVPKNINHSTIVPHLEPTSLLAAVDQSFPSDCIGDDCFLPLPRRQTGRRELRCQCDMLPPHILRSLADSQNLFSVVHERHNRCHTWFTIPSTLTSYRR